MPACDAWAVAQTLATHRHYNSPSFLLLESIAATEEKVLHNQLRRKENTDSVFENKPGQGQQFTATFSDLKDKGEASAIQ